MTTYNIVKCENSLKPLWARPADLCKLFGMKRDKVFQLIGEMEESHVWRNKTLLLSPTMRIVNIDGFEKFLLAKCKKG